MATTNLTIRRANRQRRGLTLVEMTVILSVIVVLTSVLVPTVMSHIAQARVVRARQDVRTLANAIMDFYKDTGFVPKTTDSVNGRQGRRAVDLLASAGDVPSLPDAGSLPASVGIEDVQRWVTGTTDLYGNHLVKNVPGYSQKTSDALPGWNGPYIASLPQADPWGNRYLVNVVFLKPGGGMVAEGGETKRAVFVLSAGPDGMIQTPFEQEATTHVVGGDDVVHRLQ